MVHAGLWVACLLVSLSSVSASDRVNPLFGAPHLLPSPFTLDAGTLVIGTQAAFGVTDFFQIGTDLVRDINEVFNVNAKFSLVDREEFAIAFVGAFETYNYQAFSSRNPDIRVNSWQPGLVLAYQMAEPEFACFNGITFNISQTQLQTTGIDKSGYVRGTVVGMDCSWEYNPPSKKSGLGNVFSGGVTYDFHYGIYGLGFSHHWPGFQLGLHYYPLAEKYRILPIINVGIAAAF